MSSARKLPRLDPARARETYLEALRAASIAGASHWVHHDQAERVTQLLTDFFAPAQPAGN